jgi:hypothetical protein
MRTSSKRSCFSIFRFPANFFLVTAGMEAKASCKVRSPLPKAG